MAESDGENEQTPSDYYIDWLREVEYNGPILLHSLKESEIKVVISFLDQEIG